MRSENPADATSRGTSADELIHHSFWWEGPQWLLDSQNWRHPKNTVFHNGKELPEYKSKTSYVYKTTVCEMFIYKYSSFLNLHVLLHTFIDSATTHVISSSKLAHRCPFLDKHNVIRVGGRLQKSGLLYN